MKINAEQGPALDHKGICKLPLRVRCRKIKLQLRCEGFLVFADLWCRLMILGCAMVFFAEFRDFAVRGVS